MHQTVGSIFQVYFLINERSEKTKERETPLKIMVGTSEITEVESAKLLGVMMDNDQKWNSHFWGKKGLLNSLN